MRKHGAGILIFALATITAWVLHLPVLGQEKPKAEAPAKAEAGLTIARAVVGTGVENKEPLGAAETFPASTEKVYCFLEATNVAQDMEVSFVWSLGDRELRKIAVPLTAGPRWRTWTYKNLGGQKGDWKVEIRDAQGKLLKDVKFKVE